MTVLVRLGDTYKIKKDSYDTQLKTVHVASLTKKLLTEYPYEFLGDKTKLFFDYDEKSDDATYITNTRNEIRAILIKYADDFQNGFVFTECTDNPTKISFHVIFKKICINRVDFLPIDEQELFSQLVGHERFHHIDTQVYGKKTCFRLPYGTTGLRNLSDKLYPHIPYKHSTMLLSDFSLTVADDTEVKVYSTQIERIMATELNECNTNNTQYEVHYDKVIQMLGMINLERFKVYNNWIALMVLMKTNDLPRELFIQMSENSGYKYFDEASCIKAWKNCRVNNNFGLPLIIGWLKQDGVDIKKHFPLQSPLLKELLNGWHSQGDLTDMNVASALYNNYKDNLFYTSQGWFHYKGKWLLGDSSSIFFPVMKLLTDDALGYLEAEHKKLNKEDENYIPKFKLLQSTMKAFNSLQKASKIKSVLDTAQGLFRDDKVLDTFDTKPHWFCFDNNKAFDMKANEVVDIIATDRILTTCGYDLPERVESEIELAMDMIKQLTPKENLESLLSSLSLFIYGENINEVFLVFKGEGGNGKGMLFTLVKKALGGYYYDLPSSVLTTQSKGDGRASPEMVQTRWARCVMFTEPDANKLIVKTKINEYTGRDTITVRGLFKEPISFKPNFVLGGQLNDMPRIAGGISDSIKRRTKYQMFPFSFKCSDDYDETNPLHRIADINMKERIRDDNRYRNGLLWIMLTTWMKNKGAYVSCEADKEEAKEQARINNPIIDWIELYKPSDEFIRIKDLLKDFNENNNNKLTPQEMKRFLLEVKVKIEDDNKKGHKVFIEKI
jgi:hypothetical protein